MFENKFDLFMNYLVNLLAWQPLMTLLLLFIEDENGTLFIFIFKVCCIPNFFSLLNHTHKANKIGFEGIGSDLS